VFPAVDWSRITFLESAANLKLLLRAQTGKTPPTSLAREAAVGLQQGRLFFQSAERSALEIRPLLLFYGTMAFAKALVICRTLRRFATLSQSHGVKDITPGGARIRELAIRVESGGTFPEFNDTVAKLNKLRYHDSQAMPHFLTMPAGTALHLAGMTVTLKDILARIPWLGELYRRHVSRSSTD